MIACYACEVPTLFGRGAEALRAIRLAGWPKLVIFSFFYKQQGSVCLHVMVVANALVLFDHRELVCIYSTVHT